MAIGTARASSKDNSKRRFVGGGPRPDNNKIKQDEAKERQEAWASLSPVQQLKELDRRLGEGKGAELQRERILSRIEKSKNRPATEAKQAPPQATVSEGERVKAKERRASERKERPGK